MLRRQLLKLAVFLVLFLAGGAIVNVAVAWGCLKPFKAPMSIRQMIKLAQLDDEPPERRSITEKEEQWLLSCGWPKEFLDSKMPDQAWATDSESFGVRTVDYSIEVNSLDEEHAEAVRLYTGWPFESLECWRQTFGLNMVKTQEKLEAWKTSRSMPRWDAEMWSWTLWLGSDTPQTFGARPLPCRPVWPGFAINTIIYVAILWLLWNAPRKIRRFVRVRRGRCPACGYFIAPKTCANGVCSECGATLPKRFVTPAAGVTPA